jgi:hypothetical protein
MATENSQPHVHDTEQRAASSVWRWTTMTGLLLFFAITAISFIATWPDHNWESFLIAFREWTLSLATFWLALSTTFAFLSYKHSLQIRNSDGDLHKFQAIHEINRILSQHSSAHVFVKTHDESSSPVQRGDPSYVALHEDLAAFEMMQLGEKLRLFNLVPDAKTYFGKRFETVVRSYAFRNYVLGDPLMKAEFSHLISVAIELGYLPENV